MTCQCEIYEICPECAPSQAAFQRAVAQHDAVLRSVKPSPSSSYTLAELTTLCHEYALEMENSEEGRQDINLRLTMSSLIAWLAKREREKEGGG